MPSTITTISEEGIEDSGTPPSQLRQPINDHPPNQENRYSVRVISQPKEAKVPHVVLSLIPANDPFEWEINDELHDYVAAFGLISQSKLSSYLKSVREYPDCYRYMRNSVFECVQ